MWSLRAIFPRDGTPRQLEGALLPRFLRLRQQEPSTWGGTTHCRPRRARTKHMRRPALWRWPQVEAALGHLQNCVAAEHNRSKSKCGRIASVSSLEQPGREHYTHIRRTATFVHARTPITLRKNGRTRRQKSDSNASTLASKIGVTHGPFIKNTVAANQSKTKALTLLSSSPPPQP